MYLYIYVCADFILNAFGAKRQALARTSWRFQRQRYCEKHPRIVVRESLTIKMSHFTLHWVFVEGKDNQFARGSDAADKLGPCSETF